MKTETTHTRSRRASLGGLIVQLVAFGATLILYYMTGSQAMHHLAWLILGGVPIWFVSLLVFYQRELAALEHLDLEELRREKQASGGGEAIFDPEGAAGLGFRVAESRLQWMQRYLVPGFGLATAVYLAGMGVYLYRRLTTTKLPGDAEVSAFTIGGEGWPELTNVPIALVVLAVVMLGMFLLSRYTSGMGRARDWQLLRGCGSYMLGNSIAIMALMVCLGVWQYTQVPDWEQTLAYALPLLMMVLAAEIVINFVLDIYRPRLPGVEPRACFDSRLLGLVAEPGGIASSIADALNYQFGFQVSQTWFYQLLERTFIPLVGTGALALWLLTSIVIVQPFEHAIIERFGRQLNPGGAATDVSAGTAAPLGPGIHLKWPWPIDVTRIYNTGQLHQISVGWERFDAQPSFDAHSTEVLLWTDRTHMGLEHFNLLIHPSKPRELVEEQEEAQAIMPAADESDEGFPVHMLRMEVTVQYRINSEELYLFTQVMRDPKKIILDIAWEELGRYCASSTAEFLMGEDLKLIGEELEQRITERARELQLGLEVVYVGVTNVHPEMTVAQAFREVIGAEQKRLAEIRKARLTANNALSRVAGDADLARELALATDRAREANERLNRALRVLDDIADDELSELSQRVLDLRPLFEEALEASVAWQSTQVRRERAEEDYLLGFGQTLQTQTEAQTAEEQARTAYETARSALEAALEPVRLALAREMDGAAAEAVIDAVAARIETEYWDARLSYEFSQPSLGGNAAAMLAGALAARWEIETDAASEVARAENEREAYLAAPEVYKARRLMEVLTEGLRGARKFFLAFDPGDRTVRVRFVAEDQPGMDPVDWKLESEQ